MRVRVRVAGDARAEIDRLALDVDGNLDALAVDAHLHRGGVGALCAKGELDEAERVSRVARAVGERDRGRRVPG